MATRRAVRVVGAPLAAALLVLAVVLATWKDGAPTRDLSHVAAATSCAELRDRVIGAYVHLLRALDGAAVEEVLLGSDQLVGDPPHRPERAFASTPSELVRAAAFDRARGLGCRVPIVQPSDGHPDLAAATPDSAAARLMLAMLTSPNDAARVRELERAPLLAAAALASYRDSFGVYTSDLAELRPTSLALSRLGVGIRLEIVEAGYDRYCVSAVSAGLPPLYLEGPDGVLTDTPCPSSGE